MDEPRDYVAKAEEFLLQPDALSLAAGLRPTRKPLRELLSTRGTSDDVNEALAALLDFLSSPNGTYRSVAALALGQLGFNEAAVVGRLLGVLQNDPAPDVRHGAYAAVLTLRDVPVGRATELERRQNLQRIWGANVKTYRAVYTGIVAELRVSPWAHVENGATIVKTIWTDEKGRPPSGGTSVPVQAPFAGHVEMFIRENQVFEKGQPLFRIFRDLDL
jgi:hypothetical protein